MSETIENLDKISADFRQNGCAVIPGFLSSDEIATLRSEIKRILSGVNLSQAKTGKVGELNGTDYQIDSLDKSWLWYEDGALDASGRVLVPIERAVHKIAHGVHTESEAVRRIIFSDKMRSMVRAVSGFEESALIQTMYMLKQPSIGNSLHPHQDETYLRVDPHGNVFGVWIALDDATEENGCLEFIPGSHKPPLTYFYERSKPSEQNGSDQSKVLQYVGSADYVNKPDDPRYQKCPVKTGDAVLIHGLIVHKSEANRSQNSRRAFTFHVFDNKNSVWNSNNCFQERDDYKFWDYYRSSI